MGRRTFILVCLVTLAGCVVDQDFFNYEDDALSRANSVQLEIFGSDRPDVAVVIYRATYANADTGSSDVRMAFNLGSTPAMVEQAIVNGVQLPWISTEGGLYKAKVYAKNSSDTYGRPDSVTFTYTGFDGEALTHSMPVALEFGKITTPDTIDLRQDWIIRYENAVPGDSIHVHIQAFDSAFSVSEFHHIQFFAPDTGAILIRVSEIPHGRLTKHLVLQAYRSRLSRSVSPAGKRITTFAVQRINPSVWPVKH